MNGCDPLALTTLVNTLAAVFSEQLDDRELALWSVILTQMGDTLATIAVQRNFCKTRGEQED